ncbi:histidine permease [Coccidioides immitis H538.4]|uniref:Histidine permease n=1 Tax=Coccidioides immitis H538.4 TaxID=396776 RepID=A0A0J8UK44_COCIT|nr:histidine permease [Coccidioides immitis H538.4]
MAKEDGFPPSPEIFEKETSEQLTKAGSDDVEQHGGSKLPELKRKLKSRHLQMIAIGGTIGTGLFIGSGGAIAKSGPAGALIAYAFVGSIVFSVVVSLGEMATYIPIAGAFTSYATRFVDPSLGFAMGWIYWFSWAITFALELTATGLIIQYWKSSISIAIFIAIFWVVITVINLLPVSFYGEIEFWFSTIKVLTVIGFMIFGICMNAGVGQQGYLGFTYWKNPGAFAPYLLDVIAANCNVYSGSRIAVGLAQVGSAPRFLGKTTSRGVPIWSVLFTSALGLLGFLNLSNDGSVVFEWFMNISSIAGFISWSCINGCHIRFMSVLRSRNISRDSLPYKAPFQPYLAWYGLFFNVLIIITQGFTAFIPWNTTNFFIAYVSLILFAVLFIGHKVIFRTKPVELFAVDIDTGRLEHEVDEWENKAALTFKQRTAPHPRARSEAAVFPTCRERLLALAVIEYLTSSVLTFDQEDDFSRRSARASPAGGLRLDRADDPQPPPS